MRDLGGYPAGDGQVLVRGRFYRSEALAHPGASEVHAIWDAANAAHYAALGLRTVIDLRTPRETEVAPSAWRVATGAKVVHLPMAEGGEGSDTNVMGRLLSGELTRFDAYDLARLYQGALDRRAEVFVAAARLLATSDRCPLLVHCSAGKDRTGMLVAVVLEALGTPRELVVRDYALTGIFRPNRVASYAAQLAAAGLDADAVRVLFETPAPAMDAALGYLDTVYGGAASYLVEVGGLDPAELAGLRANLLATSGNAPVERKVPWTGS